MASSVGITDCSVTVAFHNQSLQTLLLKQEHRVRSKGACCKCQEEFLQEKVVFQ